MDGPDLRVSDEDRDSVAQLLREHCAAGRLTIEEFDEVLLRRAVGFGG
jgi:hypothetical protein